VGGFINLFLNGCGNITLLVGVSFWLFCTALKSGSSMMFSPPLMSTKLYKETVSWVGSHLYLTGYGAIHDWNQEDHTSLYELLHIPFAQDWKLQIKVNSQTTKLQNELGTWQGYAVSDASYIATKQEQQHGSSKGRIIQMNLSELFYTPGGASYHSTFQNEIVGNLVSWLP